MKVRALARDDLEAAQGLYQALAGTQIPTGARGHWEVFLGHSGTSVHGVELGSELIAMVTLHLLPSMTYGGLPYGLIENVVTAPAHRGQGVGRLAMEAAIDRAWAAGTYKIMLLTGQSRGSRGFYEKLGFTAEEKFGMTLRKIPPGGRV